MRTNLTSVNFLASLSAMLFVNLIVGCHAVPNTKKDGTTVEPPETAVVELALVDTDGDGVPDGPEVNLCGLAAPQLDTVTPNYVFPEDTLMDDGTVVPKDHFVSGAPEICDGLDNDCDGLTDEGLDVNGVDQEDEVVRDFDGDGMADCRDGDKDGDKVPDSVDCDDFNTDFPSDEVCDGVDNDCDGTIDEQDAIACQNFYIDSDGDGYGAPNSGVCLCAAIPEQNLTSEFDSDCDDGDADINIDAVEICDGIDNNCLNGIDEGTDVDTDGDGSANCVDEDDDGDGTPDTGDCKPLDANIHPNADEVCDGVDNNCDGETDEGFLDQDLDGTANCVDNDDDDDGVADEADNCPINANPNQLDTDLDGAGDACDTDADQDGVLNAEDNCPLVKNALQEDNDLDGAGDACDDDDDNDGVADSDDNCPLTLASTLPEGTDPADQLDTDDDGQGDVCDADDDNDGVLDEVDNCQFVQNEDQLDTDGDGVGDACVNDADGDGDPDETDCAPLDSDIHKAAVEDCDGVDNNCKDGVDEGFIDTDNDGMANCVDGDDDGDLYPDGDDCAPLDASINPGVEFDECDGVNNDCDGAIDENPTAATGIKFFFDGDDDGYGITGNFLIMCAPNEPFVAFQGGDCQDGITEINPGAADVCGNGVDENCDGSDAECACVPVCEGKVCGDNGCGGFCADGCAADQKCSDDQSACLPLTESGLCGNGVDDDGDGNADCLDADCEFDTACTGCNADTDCNDDNECTDDTCTGGECVNTNNTATCDDNNACTTGDVCSGGTCGSAGTLECDDSDPCTADSCSSNSGCVNTPITSDACATCLTSDDCDGTDLCGLDGKCHGDAEGETVLFQNGEDDGPDGTPDCGDDDGDGECEAFDPATDMCCYSIDPSMKLEDLLEGDCDDNGAKNGLPITIPCQGIVDFDVDGDGDVDSDDQSACTFQSDGSFNNCELCTEHIGDNFANSCDEAQ